MREGVEGGQGGIEGFREGGKRKGRASERGR